MSIVTLTTDFGLADPYVAIMKGVMYGIAPDVTLVDISHQIEPQNVRQGGLILAEGIDYYPVGTIHMAVVDPGVGSSRRPIVAMFDRFTFVGPDNGIITPLLTRERAIIREIAHPALRLPSVSTTFHGRDIFAPTAATLVTGFPFADVGPLVIDPVILPDDAPSCDVDRVEGRVVRIDRFGNLLTNITEATLSAAFGTNRAITITCDGETFPLVATYADVPVGSPGALIGSHGAVELFVREGDAGKSLRRVVGESVVLSPL